MEAQRTLAVKYAGGDTTKAWPPAPALVVDIAGPVRKRVHVQSDAELAAVMRRHDTSLGLGALAEMDVRTQCQLLAQYVGDVAKGSEPSRPVLLECLRALWLLASAKPLLSMVSPRIVGMYVCADVRGLGFAQCHCCGIALQLTTN